MFPSEFPMARADKASGSHFDDEAQEIPDGRCFEERS